MKKITLIAALLCVAFASSAAQARDALKDRRTLFAGLGEKNVVFEAPRNMCFLDRTQKAENEVFLQTADRIQKKGRGQLIALFAPCLEIAAVCCADDLTPIQNLGAVIWSLPRREDAYALPAQDYIDLREAGIGLDTRKSLTLMDDVTIDDKPLRQDNAVTVGYSAAFEVLYLKHILTGVDAATLIHGEPIDISLTSFVPYSERTPDLRALMKKFLAQQHELNRP